MRNPNRLTNSRKETMSITFTAPTVVREIPARTISLSKIDIEYFVDSPADKVVEAYTRQAGKIVLWEGDAYDAIGNWTNADVEARIKEIYNQPA